MTLLVVLTLMLLGIVSEPPAPAENPDLAEVELVRERLTPLQLLSFATNREYCGYLVREPDGDYAFTDMVRGGHDGCTPLIPLSKVELVASVHTHGAYDPEVPAEFPTVLDMNSDRIEGVNGYIATPGGRLWYVDTRRMEARQLCGLGCLPQDSGFRAGDDGPIAQRYTYRELLRLESPL